MKSMVVTLLGLAGCAQGKNLPPLATVEQVDLGRYLGTWYEIAAIPQRFQKGCVATTATYRLRADGDIDVLNRCRKDQLDGEEKSASGRAWVTDRSSNAKLKVSFFWPFSGHYWIIGLDPGYQWAVVGHPSRDYCWILSRSPQFAEPAYQAILGRLREQGYDTSRLVRTVQGGRGSDGQGR